MFFYWFSRTASPILWPSRASPTPGQHDQSHCIADISATADFFLTRIFDFKPPSYLWPMNRADAAPSRQEEKQNLNFSGVWKEYDMRFTFLSLREILKEFFSISNRAIYLVCVIGSISEWTFCFPEDTNLNQEKQHPARFLRDTSFQKVFENSKLSLS